MTILTAAPSPVVTGISAVPSSAGSLRLGKHVTFTLDIDTAVQVVGDPTLLLSNGGIAIFDAAASTGTSLVFDYTVAAGQDTADLLVNSVALNGATITAPASFGFADATSMATSPGSDTGIVVDTTAPAVTVALASDSGTSSSDSLTNTPTVSGTGAANAVVMLTEDATTLGTTTADATGAWSFTPALTDGTHTITATETDAAGNAGLASISFTLDTTAPVVAASAPSATEAASAAGSPVSFVALTSDAIDGTDPAIFTENGTPVTPGITFFSIGSHTVLATATDVAGNTAKTSFSFDVRDTTAPVVAAGAPASTEATSAAGASVIFAASAIDAVNGTVPVTFTEDNIPVASGDTFAIGQHTIFASATDASGNSNTVSFSFEVVDTTAPVVTASAPAATEATSATGASVTFTASSTDVVDVSDAVTFSEKGTAVTSGGTFAVGHHAIVASAKDAAINTGTTQFSFDVVDTTAPVVTASAPASTEATSASGASVTFTASAADVVDGTDPVTFSENGSPVISGDTFSIGLHTIVASAKDAANNTGTTQFSFDVVDTTPPAVTAALVHDTGASSSDHITSNAAISGTGDANTVVTLKEGVTLLGTTVADGTGAWSFTPTLTDGVHTITARETDKSGNTGSAPLTFTLDTKPPTVKAVLSTDTGSSTSDGITNITQIFGAGDPNALVTLTESGTTLGTTTANAAGGWSFTPGLTTDGLHSITASETDAAGNTALATVSFTLDTKAPAVTINTPVISAANSGLVTASGTAEVGSVVQLFDGTVRVGATNADSNGSWSLAFALASGAHSLSATATDVAGNTSQPATTPQIVVAAPLTTPDLTAASDKGISNTDNITNINTPVFTGSGAEAGAAVEIFDGATVVGTATADGFGNWTVTSLLSEGGHTVTAKQTSAGRTSTASGSLSVTIDTVAPTTTPTTPDLTAASDSGTSSTDNITNVSTPTFTGKADPGTLIQVSFDGGAQVSSITTLANGTWTTPASVFVPSDGTHTVFATAMDVAGNVTKASGTFSFTIDRVAPLPPTYASLTANADGSVKLAGSAEANTTVAVFDGTTQIGVTSAIATGTSPNAPWSFTTAAHLPDTLHVFLSRATDVAGNVGVISGSSGSAQLGSTKADTIQGTIGNDLIDGGAGNDSIDGGAGNDFIIGGAGADTMSGGSGADTLSFLAGFGKDIINDFAATGTVHDVINFHANPVLNSFANVLSHSVQSGANVVISQDASNTLTLKNVALPSNPPPNSPNILSSADFTFV